jgi:hypothetical protein
LFGNIFSQRRPTILRDLNCIGAAGTLLREQELEIPKMITLPEIVTYFDTKAENDIVPVNTTK